MRFRLFAVVLVLAGCATAQDDQNVDWGDPPKDTGTAPDTAATDTGSAVDSTTSGDDTSTSSPPDTGTAPDTTVVDTSPAVDSALPDTTPAVDTAPPADTGPTGGACMWCTTGTCATPLSDYFCFLDCVSGGFLDCHFDPAASMPCTCKL